MAVEYTEEQLNSFDKSTLVQLFLVQLKIVHRCLCNGWLSVQSHDRKGTRRPESCRMLGTCQTAV